MPSSVEQLTSRPVGSYKDIDAQIDSGTRNRTVASTNMNATSRYLCHAYTSSYTDVIGEDLACHLPQSLMHEDLTALFRFI